MAWTTDDLIAIDNAIKGGTTRVRYADREEQYRSLDELIRIRNLIRADLGYPGESPMGTRVYLGFDKGLR